MMMKKPDNVVFDILSQEYDSHKKNYPTDLGSPAFNSSVLKKDNFAFKHLKAKFDELNLEYKSLLTKLKWNELIYNSEHNFIPIAGETYHLYKNKNITFLSIIEPKQWDMEHIGSFKLLANDIWEQIIE
tara:strand:+ start:47 stop:433 length:387 start_codon:yes stop_codon:yes gene_type:complete